MVGQRDTDGLVLLESAQNLDGIPCVVEDSADARRQHGEAVSGERTVGQGVHECGKRLLVHAVSCEQVSHRGVKRAEGV